MSSYLKTISATISASGTESNAVDLDYTSLVGVFVPGNLLGNVTLKNSLDGVNFAPVYDDNGSLVTITTPATNPSEGLWIAIQPHKVVGLRYIKLVATAVQVGSRELRVVVREVN